MELSLEDYQLLIDLYFILKIQTTYRSKGAFYRRYSARVEDQVYNLEKILFNRVHPTLEVVGDSQVRTKFVKN
jgi:hypothetical protein